MPEPEVEVAFSGQRVAAEGHGDLLHRDLEAGRRERLDEDVCVAINLAPYDPEAVTEYLTAAGHAPYAQGRRYGADGDGYSIYLTDPEGTVVELKSGN